MSNLETTLFHSKTPNQCHIKRACLTHKLTLSCLTRTNTLQACASRKLLPFCSSAVTPHCNYEDACRHVRLFFLHIQVHDRVQKKVLISDETIEMSLFPAWVHCCLLHFFCQSRRMGRPWGLKMTTFPLFQQNLVQSFQGCWAYQGHKSR